MNQNLYNSAFKDLKKYLETNSKYKPIVRTTPIGDTYPLVVVEEVENSLSTTSSCRLQTTSLVGIEVNIYAKNQTIGNAQFTNRTIANELSILVDDIMFDLYGMRRITSKPTPNVDTTIYRKTMIYNRIQDDHRSRFF